MSRCCGSARVRVRSVVFHFLFELFYKLISHSACTRWALLFACLSTGRLFCLSIRFTSVLHHTHTHSLFLSLPRLSGRDSRLPLFSNCVVLPELLCMSSTFVSFIGFHPKCFSTAEHQQTKHIFTSPQVWVGSIWSQTLSLINRLFLC